MADASSCEDYATTTISIYDAALDFDAWPAALERMADHLGAAVACLVKHDLASARGEMLMVRTDPRYAQLYTDHYAKLNVFAERARNQPPQTCVTDRMYLGKEELFRTEFYDGFMKPQDVHTLLNVYLLTQRQCGTRIAFARAHQHGEWEQQHIDCLSRLAPHVHRAALLNRELETLRLDQDDARACLERLPQAVFVLHADGRLLHTSQAADHLLAAADGLHVERRCLATCNGRETARLRRMVDEAARGGPAGSSEFSLTVSRPSGAAPYRLIVVPRPAFDSWFAARAPAAFVIASDPENAIAASIDWLQRQHDLTTAEANVVVHVTRGRGLAEAAAAMHISITTVRTHLQRAFEKTRTRRQAELVRLVAEQAVAAVADAKATLFRT